ncbi:Heme ABC transporter, cell surface heme and hemoprotein receptor HmuT [Indibacter alkaliphilus LW1]|uniref:Heme ABC transporter, cell surface heme and hemoprotein receptor HmuT n=1 Tax=Indibacter alkaliphilus (strain CCUG 57479 / KCTC 22604 / LW1) TaxID=1189612 RepID=S2DNB9_INDAL|nr:ABC transporter substrate-binding protein [Indibacter alkaliphilus]EOZ98725.1 Heme ABC transporter, cell surface heme and hemoprotein receptor HmuT [Indibacter alkaliphilus LW1]
MKRRFFIVFLLLGACTGSQKGGQGDELRIITAGGTITEIIYELGFGDQVVATDITSTYPASMQELPSIGYRNQIKAEGILALGPDLILAEEGYLSDDVVNQLKGTGTEVQFFKKPVKTEETLELIENLADFLEVREKGESLKKSLVRDLEELSAATAQKIDKKPTVAFVMARGEEMVFVAGEDTFAESIITMAGAESVGKGFKDFIPLTPESLVSMNPDYLLFFESGIKSMGGVGGLEKIRGIQQTTAYQKNQILSFDGLYLSGFGPRIGKAALELSKEVGY